MSVWFTERYYLLARDREGAWEALNRFVWKVQEQPGEPELDFDDFNIEIKLQRDYAGNAYALVTLDVGFNGLDSRIPNAFKHFMESYPQFGIQGYDYRNDEEAMILGLQSIWANLGGNAVEWYFKNVVKGSQP